MHLKMLLKFLIGPGATSVQWCKKGLCAECRIIHSCFKSHHPCQGCSLAGPDHVVRSCGTHQKPEPVVGGSTLGQVSLDGKPVKATIVKVFKAGGQQALTRAATSSDGIYNIKPEAGETITPPH